MASPSYALVSSCDCSGAFSIIAPAPALDGRHQVWRVCARVQQEVRDAFTHTLDASCLQENLKMPDSIHVKLPVKDAVAYFLRPALQRTTQLGISLHGETKRIVRYLESLGASNFDATSPYAFTCPELATEGIGAGMCGIVGQKKADANIPKGGQSEVHAMFGTGGLATSCREELRSWRFGEGDLHEVGVAYGSVGCEAALQALAASVAMSLSEAEHVVRRIAMMAHHMFVVYSLRGDAREARLFRSERDQVVIAAFYSGIFTALARKTTMELVRSGQCRIINREFELARPYDSFIPFAGRTVHDSYNGRRGLRGKELLTDLLQSLIIYSEDHGTDFVASLEDSASPVDQALQSLLEKCYEHQWEDTWINQLSTEHRPNLIQSRVGDKLCKLLRRRCLRALRICVGHLQHQCHAPGCLVVLNGLKKQFDLNCRLGVVIGSATQSGRLAVQLFDVPTLLDRGGNSRQLREAACEDDIFTDLDMPPSIRSAIVDAMGSATCPKSLKHENLVAIDDLLCRQLGATIQHSCVNALAPGEAALFLATTRLAAEIELVIGEAQSRQRTGGNYVSSLKLSAASAVAYREASELAMLFRLASVSARCRFVRAQGQASGIQVEAPSGKLSEWFRPDGMGRVEMTSSASRRLFAAVEEQDGGEALEAVFEDLLQAAMEAQLEGKALGGGVLALIQEWKVHECGIASQGWQDGAQSSEAKQALQCAACGNAATRRCSGCKAVVYCSSVYSSKDWRKHKKLCRAQQVSRP